MGCGCPPLAVDMNINGRLSAVLALTSTGCTTSAPAGGWITSWTTPSQAPTVTFSARDTPPVAARAASRRETPLTTS